jgi:hypothetical protein
MHTQARRRWLVALVLVAGILVRVAALPFPGTGDVRIWKVWTYNAATIGVSRMYGVGGTFETPSPYRLLRFGALEAIADYPPLSLYELGIAGSAYQRAAGGSFPDTAALTMSIKAVPLVFDAALCALLFVSLRRVAAMCPPGGRSWRMAEPAASSAGASADISTRCSFFQRLDR